MKQKYHVFNFSDYKSGLKKEKESNNKIDDTNTVNFIFYDH